MRRANRPDLSRRFSNLRALDEVPARGNPYGMTREQMDEDAARAEVVERLAERFPQTAPVEIIAAVDEAYTSFEQATVRDFVPVLAEREARARLERPLR